MMDAEVIVVGGGPAGSATATLLARHGHDVLLLDRATFPRPKPCAEYLSPATAGVLERLGALPAVEALRPARPFGMRLLQRGGAQATVRYPDASGPRRAICVPREKLDAVLLDHARSHGVRVGEATHVDRAAVAGDGVVVGARRERRAVELSARLVVGADGARSVVARSLGVQRRVAWPRRVGLVAHYRETERSRHLREWGEMHVGHGVYCGLAPLPDGLVNVGLVMSPGAARRARGGAAALVAGLRALPAAEQVLAGAERVTPVRGVSPIAARVSRAGGERFLLVGDAAGFLDPFTGEGVFRALRGAELVAEVAVDALAGGTLSAGALRHYESLRRAEFGAKSALSWVIQGLLAAPPLLGYALRRLAVRERPASVLGSVLGDYRPASEALRPAFLFGLLRP